MNNEMQRALNLIAFERKRQIGAEGYTVEHDDAHIDGELARAAACYAAGSTEIVQICLNPRFQADAHGEPLTRVSIWPWEAEDFRPSTRLRDLAKAGALIVAEIERLQRLTQAHAHANSDAEQQPERFCP